MQQAQTYIKLAALYVVAGVGGYVFYRLNMPLPWMIGPLVVTAVIVFFGQVNIRVPVQTRPFGQGIVASQVGLAFSPVVFASLLDMAPLLVAMAFMTIVTGLLVAMVLSRMAGIPVSSALIATLPTSPVEAAVMGERYDFPPAPIILSQTLRITTVVVLIPAAIFFIDDARADAASRFNGHFEILGTVALMMLAVFGMWLFRKLRVSNPFFLGPLALSSVVTALGIDLPDYPSVILWTAQVVLGTWLGSNFRRELFTSAGRLVTASIVSTMLFVGGSALIAVVLSLFIDMPWEMTVLATAPGGVTEMALTAKFLHMDVALITAFHIVRIFIVVPLGPIVIDRIHKRMPS